MNDIVWKVKALKQLERIRVSAVRKRIYIESQALTDFPNCQNVKKLKSHDYSYCLRIGDYRVFFEFDGDVHIVSIEEVKKRDESTY
jgi:mRNA-degrading endonuclease RelE of RelBE toxin-antitoxin system